MNFKYYLYRHIRKDNQLPFYIGIGTKNKNPRSFKTEYARAFSKSHRNNIWKNIVNKTDYSVEIMLESNDLEVIKSKEKEFIKLYGRKDLDLGLLCNLTNGGDGNEKWIVTEEFKEKVSKNAKIWHLKNPHFLGKTVFQYSLEGNFLKKWGSYHEITEKLDLYREGIARCIKANKNVSQGFQWYLEDKGQKIDKKSDTARQNRSGVIMYDKDYNEIMSFSSITEAIVFLKIDDKSKGTNISKAAKYNKIAFGYKWKYKNETKKTI